MGIGERLNSFANSFAQAAAPEAYDRGRQRAQERQRENAFKLAGNSLMKDDYGGASQALLGVGDLDNGLALREYGREQQQAQQQQTQVAEQQRLQQGMAFTQNLAGIPAERRAEWAAQNWQHSGANMSFEDYLQTEGMDGFSDQGLSEDLAQFRAQLGQGPPAPAEAPERNIIEGADGYKYYQDTGERVLPDVQRPEPTLTPQQQASLSVQQGRLALDREKFGFQQEQAEREAFTDGSDLPIALGGQGNGFTRLPAPEEQGAFFNAAFGDEFIRNPDEQYPDQFEATPQGETVSRPHFNAPQYQKYLNSYQGRNDAERLDEIRVIAAQAGNQTELGLQQMEHLLNEGAPVGPAAEFRANASRLPGVGVLPGIPSREQGANLDAFRAISTRLALELTQQTKGAISDREMAQFQASVPNWSQSEAGARTLIGAMRQIVDRQKEYASGADQWSNIYGGLSIPNKDNLTFDQAWAQYIIDNPIGGLSEKSPRDLSDEELLTRLAQ